ncbi:MAG TPA: hypothetical protein VG738_09125 [Chitinophagaceae bacterium]|nr:hypothetical protein [Chitinophagaceae bacterium]
MKFAWIFGTLLFFTTALHAQDITGIWRGTFYSGYGPYKQEFKYEVQIDQLDSKHGPNTPNPIKGVTYSYRLTSFYGKARFIGIYNQKAGILTLKEDTLVEVKMGTLDFSCLMTCYLQYHKEGDKEALEGSFSSVVTNTGKDCGSGTVYLERVQESDFQKEDFLLKKKPKKQVIASKKPPLQHRADSSAVAKKTTPPAKQPQQKAQTPQKQQPLAKQTTPPKKTQAPATKRPSATNNSTAKKPAVKTPVPPVVTADSTLVKSEPVQPPAQIIPPTEEPIKRQLPPAPDVIKQRENPLVKTIVTTSPDILIELYDNGEVDGDTITVYHNNEIVAYKKGLNTKPITIKIKATPQDTHHELVMVADNLGSIPPNTALMVVRTGGKRYELFISSNEQKNAKVVIDYQPLGSN